MKARSLFLALSLIPVFAFGSHKIAGLELSYERTATGKYDIFIHMVRHCDGASLGARDLILRCSASTVTVPAAQQTLVSTQKLNACQSSPCNGVGNYEEKVWKAQVDLSASSCCEWSVEYSNDYRNIGGVYFVKAVLNKCVTNKTGGHFVQLPEITLPYNQDIALNFGFKSIDPTDSISYELVSGQTGLNQSMTYSGNFSPVRPITFFGFPNQNLNFPAGFHLGQDGFIRFRPTSINQVATIVVEVKIWRIVNGQMNVVGITRRDIEVQVLNMVNNAVPSIPAITSGQQNVFFCEEDTTPLRWESRDTDDDSTFIEIVKADSGIQISTDYNLGKQVSLNVSIDTAYFDTSYSKVFYLQFWLRDNRCPYPKSRLYTLALRQAKMPVAQFTQTLQCRQLNTSIIVTDSVNGFFRAWYSFYDSYNNLLGSSINGLFNSSNLPLGPSYLHMSYGFSGNCVFDTSVVLNVLPGFKFSLSGPNKGCEGDTLKLELLDQGAIGTYTYQWANLTNPTTPDLIDSQYIVRVFSPLDAVYEVMATDTAGCYVNYSKLVRRVKWPKYTMDSVVLACQGDSAWIGPSSILFSDQKLWMDRDTNFPRREIKTGWHPFYAIHENLCEVRDSVYRGNHTSPKLEEVPADTNLCQGTKYFINTTLGSRPFTYDWNGIQTTIPRTITQSEGVNLVVKDKHGCRDSVAFQLWVNEKPALVFSSGQNFEFCQGDSVEVKVLNAPSNASLIWSGFPGSDIKIYYPGMYVLNLTDSISCTYAYTVFAVGWPAPDAGFTYQAQAGGIAFTPDVLNVNHTWFFGDGNTSNNGLPVHLYAQPGNYLVKHYASESEHGCWAKDSLTIVVISLPELEQWGISIFPNPFQTHFTISCSAGTEPYPVQLFDVQGKMIPVQTKAEENRLLVYGLENLASGTYIIRILTPDGPVETRLQKGN